MAIVGIRDLNHRTKEVIETLLETREPAILTRQGQPIAAILPLDQERLNELVISTAPEFATSMRKADEQFAAGQTRSLDEAMAEIRARRSGGDGQEQGGWASGYGSAFKDALAERARRLSEAIVDKATQSGALSVEEPGDEPLQAIVAANTRLYEKAFVAANYRVVEATMEEIADAGEASAPVESPDAAELAAGQVESINRSLLERGKEKGGLSLDEYARELQEASDVVEAAAELEPPMATS